MGPGGFAALTGLPHVTLAHAVYLLLCTLGLSQTLLRVTEDNDALAWQRPTADRWYSQGLAIQATRWGPERAWELGLSQQLYTPWGIARATLRPEERPFAGLLLVHGAWGRAREQWLHSLRLDLGVVGPASLASWGQERVHRVVPQLTLEPGAWHLQLENEAVVNLRAERSGFLEGPAWRLEAGVGGSVGKLWTQADAGLALQLGRPVGWSPPSARRWRVQSPAEPGIALLIAADGWLVLHDITLDGNTHGQGHWVTREPLVGELRGGLVAGLGRWSASYTHVLRSREFEGQLELHQYGSASLSVRF